MMLFCSQDSGSESEDEVKPRTRDVAAFRDDKEENKGRILVEANLVNAMQNEYIRFLSGRWIIDQFHKGLKPGSKRSSFKMKRNQDLLADHPDAFLTGEQVVSMYATGDPDGDIDEVISGRGDMLDEDGKEVRAVLAMSYPWLSKKHPDPKGHHLATLVTFLETQFEKYPGLEDLAVFWDFASMPQRPFAAGEEKIFNKGLMNINAVYGVPNTDVLRMKHIPADAENPRPYDNRGWCYFETCVASLKEEEGSRIVDLAEISKEVNGTDGESLWKKVRKAWDSLFVNMDAKEPDEFDEEVAKREFTNGMADMETVKKLYRNFFVKLHEQGEFEESDFEDIEDYIG